MKKLASRKFLAMVAAVLMSIAALLQGDLSPAQLGTLALGIVAIVSYLFGEAQVDAASAQARGAAAAGAAAATAPATSQQASSAAVDTAKGMTEGQS